MRSGDFRANSYVKQVFARNWLESETLSATVINGVLYLRGHVRFLPAKRALAGDVTSEFLFRLEAELKAIPGVKRVRWQLENWEKDETGLWVPLTPEGREAEQREKKAGRAAGRPGAPGAPAPQQPNAPHRRGDLL